MTRSSNRLRARLRDAGRREILHALETLVLEEGLAGAVVAKVAKRAGCGIGTLYNHFGNRDAMVAALVDSRVRRPLHLIGHSIDLGSTPEDVLQQYLEQCTRWAQNSACLLRGLGVGFPGASGRHARPDIQQILCEPDSSFTQIVHAIKAGPRSDRPADDPFVQTTSAAIIATLIDMCASENCRNSIGEHMHLAKRAILASARLPIGINTLQPKCPTELAAQGHRTDMAADRKEGLLCQE